MNVALDYSDRLALASTEASAVLTDGSVLTTRLIFEIARRWAVLPEDVLGGMWPSYPPGQDT